MSTKEVLKNWVGIKETFSQLGEPRWVLTVINSLEQDVTFVYYLSLNVFYMGPYGGANGAGRPKNGASHLRSYFGEESVST